jgi:hypothetical protein
VGALLDANFVVNCCYVFHRWVLYDAGQVAYAFQDRLGILMLGSSLYQFLM